MEGYKGVMLSGSCQPNTPCASQLSGQEWFYLTRTELPYLPCLLSWGHGKGKEHM